MNSEVTIKISTTPAQSVISESPVPAPPEQLQAAIAQVPATSGTISGLPVPSAPEAMRTTIAGEEAPPLPTPMGQLERAASEAGPMPTTLEQMTVGMDRLPEPSPPAEIERISESMGKLPEPVPLEGLEAMAGAPAPEETPEPEESGPIKGRGPKGRQKK